MTNNSNRMRFMRQTAVKSGNIHNKSSYAIIKNGTNVKICYNLDIQLKMQVDGLEGNLSLV